MKNIDDALAGALDIIAETISDTAEIRSWLRNFALQEGFLTSKVKKDWAKQKY